jgi:dihydrofolate reductase
MDINIIVAICKNTNGIGLKNSLPWKFKRDMKYFSLLTKQNFSDKQRNVVLMGRKTWESIPNKFKPLKERMNIIISSSLSINQENALSFNSIEKSLDYCKNNNYSNIWVIGGVSIYKYFIDNNLLKSIYITEIDKYYECDTFFPNIDKDKWILDEQYTFIERENDVNLTFKHFYKKY